MGEYTYRNLLDNILEMMEDSSLAGSREEQFRRLLSEYFFKDESREKAVALLFKNFEIPSVIISADTLIGFDPEQILSFTVNEVPNETLAGKIILSKQFLKTYYSNHQPEFKKIPPDVQIEILDRIKEKNDMIYSAFVKMKEDIAADKKRKIATLAALIINNIHKRKGIPYKKLEAPAEIIFKDNLLNGDDVFTGKPTDLADLGDDVKIKNIIKEFFPIKQHKDLVEFTDLFKLELKRYQRRVKAVNQL